MLQAGLLENFFQFGYVTTDLEAAMAVYRERFDVPAFMILDGSVLKPGAQSTLRVALAWIGDTMVELIQPVGEPSPLYAEALPKAGIRLHHLGYRVRDEGRWAGVLAAIAQNDVPMVAMSAPGGSLECAYADARAHLGHHLEFVWTKAGQPDYFAHVPRAPDRREA